MVCQPLGFSFVGIQSMRKLWSLNFMKHQGFTIFYLFLKDLRVTLQIFPHFNVLNLFIIIEFYYIQLLARKILQKVSVNTEPWVQKIH